MSAASIADQFREAMRKTASGVAVLASDGAAGPVGLTVSTLCSLSLEPPSVVACINRGSKSLATILENGVFTANVLADGQSRVAECFAGQVPEMSHDRFAAGTWTTLTTGAPALDGALASFDCRVAATFDFGSHRIVIGEVVDIRSQEIEPLVYSDRGFRRLEAA